MATGAAKVTVQVKDYTAYIEEMLKGIMCMEGVTERGPIDVVMFCSSWPGYEDLYGGYMEDFDFPFLVKRAMDYGASVYVNRIAHFTDRTNASTLTAVKAEKTILDNGSTATHGYETSDDGPFTIAAATAATVLGSETGPYLIDATHKVLKIKIDGVGGIGSQTITLTEGAERTTQQIVDQINADSDDVSAEVVGGKIRLTSDKVGGGVASSIEFETVSNDAYSRLGFEVGTTTGTDGTDYLALKIDGGATQEFELTAGSRSATQIVADLSALTSATASVVGSAVKITATATGVGSTVQILEASTADTPLGFDNEEHAGEAAGADGTLKFTAVNEGAWGNGITVTITEGTIEPDSTFNVVVELEGYELMTETYEDCTIDTIEALINGISKLVTVTDLGSEATPPENLPALGAYDLASGDDGLIVDGASVLDANDYIGNETLGTGLYAYDVIDDSLTLCAPESILVATPQSVINAGHAYVEEHRDGEMEFLSVCPANLTAQSARAFRLGTAPYDFSAFNTRFGCMFFGDLEVADPENGNATKYINCLGDVCGITARKDINSYEWFPAAGVEVGLLINCEGVKYDVGSSGRAAQADLLVAAQINPVMTQSGYGICLWGDETLQRTASAFRQRATSRLTMVSKKALKKFGKRYCFKPNTPILWKEMYDDLNAWGEWMQARFGFYSFAVQCDQNASDFSTGKINTPETIQRGEVRARFYFKPTYFSKYVGFEMIATRLSVRFTDFYNVETIV